MIDRQPVDATTSLAWTLNSSVTSADRWPRTNRRPDGAADRVIFDDLGRDAIANDVDRHPPTQRGCGAVPDRLADVALGQAVLLVQPFVLLLEFLQALRLVRL